MGATPRHFSKSLSLLALAVASPGTAQDDLPIPAAFEQFGKWLVTSSPNGCDIESTDPSTRIRMSISDYRGERTILLQGEPLWPEPSGELQAALRIDGRIVPGDWSYASGTFWLKVQPDPFADAFRHGDEVAFTYEGQALAHFSLAGSSRAYARYSACEQALANQDWTTEPPPPR